jgi:hypothetical protein
MQDLAVEKN